MPQWIRDSAVMAASMVVLALLGAIRVLGDRRFRARRALPTTRALRRARYAFLGATAITVVGFLALIARVNGGPAYLGYVGFPSTIAGLLVLTLSLVWLARERLRLPD